MSTTIPITMWAARIVGTNDYMTGYGKGRGGSHEVFSDWTHKSSLPRLWTSKINARIAITYWKKGKFYGDRDGDVHYKPVFSRRDIEVEFVPVVVHLPLT